MRAVAKPKLFKPVVFRGPFTRVTVHENHLEYRKGVFPFRRKGYIEFESITGVEYTFMTNKLRVGSKDGRRHVFQLFSGGKCRDLVMRMKLK